MKLLQPKQTLLMFLWFSQLQLGIAQDNSRSEAQILGIKAEYAHNEPIVFTVRRDSDHPIQIACAADVRFEGEFVEWRWDIFQKALKAATRPSIRLTKASIEFKWDIPNLPMPLKPEAGHSYRIRIEIDSPKSSIVSNEFRIVANASSQAVSQPAKPNKKPDEPKR